MTYNNEDFSPEISKSNFNSPNPELLLEHYPTLSLYLVDPSFEVQEKAMDVFLVLLNNFELPPDKTMKEIALVLIEKCLAVRDKDLNERRGKVMKCILGLTGRENCREMMKELFIERLSPYTDSKVVVVILQVLVELLVNFGNGYFAVQDFAPYVRLLVKAEDQQVQDMALKYLEEAQRWDEQVLPEAVETLAKDQKEEFKNPIVHEVEQVKNKEMDIDIKEQSVAHCESNIDWCLELLKTKDPSKRCEMLKELTKSIGGNSMETESIVSLKEVMKELMQDANPLVSNQTLKTLSELTRTFKDKLADVDVLKLVLDKCTEENTLTNARNCFQNLVLLLQPKEIMEFLKEILTSNNPFIAETCVCITAILPKAEPSLTRAIEVELEPILVNLINNDSAEVRKAVSDCLNLIKPHSLEPSPSKGFPLSQRENYESEGKEINTNRDNTFLKETLHIYNEDIKSRVYKSEEEEKEAKLELEREYKKLLEKNTERVMSASEATKQVFEIMPTDILAQFDMNEWSERQKGLRDLNDWLNINTDRCKNEGKVVEALIMWFKRKFGDFRPLDKEVTKELLVLFKMLFDKYQANMNSASEIVPALIARMSDTELTETCIDIIAVMAKSIAPAYISALTIRTCYESSMIKEGLLILSKMISLYGAASLPSKLSLHYAKECLMSEDLMVRNEAIRCIVEIYKIKGEEIKALLSDLNEAVYKNIEEELSKVKPIVKEEQATIEIHETPTDNRIDISSQLTQKVIMGLSAPLSKHRLEAKNEVERIIAAADNNIRSTGLSHLFMALKGRMKEPSKNLARGFITLVGNLAVAMGQGFQQYTKIILQSLMQNLLDKQSMIRSEALVTLEKVYQSIGLEPIMSGMGRLLASDNHYGKNGVLTWILKHKEELAKCELRGLVESLSTIIQERTRETAELAESIVREIRVQLGAEEFTSLIQDLNPIAKDNIESVFRETGNARGNVDKEFSSDDVRIELETNTRVRSKNRLSEMGNYQSNNKSKLKSSFEVSSYNSLNNTPMKSYESKSKPKNQYLTSSNLSSRTAVVGTINQKTRENCKSCNFMRSKSNLRRAALDCSILSNRSSRDLSQTRKFEGMSSSRSTNDLQKQFQVKLRSGLREPKKAFPERRTDSLNESTPDNFSETVVIATLGNKTKRAEQDKKFKWPINEVRSANVERLKRTLRNCLNPNVFEWMFSVQFRKNMSAISALTEGMKNEFPSLLDLLDLLLKWIAMKLIDQPNAAMTKEILEFLTLLFNKMNEIQYHLLDFEASAILPLLCEKLGINNTTFKQQFKELLRMANQIYSPAKITSYLISTLETTNNKRTKIECLSLANEFVRKYETAKNLTPKEIRTIVKLVNSSNTDVKNDSLDIMTELYSSRGDSLWMLVGKLTEKTDELLRRRFNIDESTSMRREKYSMSSNDDLFLDVSDSRKRQRKSASKKKSTPSFSRLENNMRKGSIERDSRLLSTPVVEREYMSPSESESLFSTTGRLEDNYKTSRMHMSIDTSQTQEEAVEVESLEQALEILKTGSITKRVNALMYLNEKTVSTLEEEKECLIKHCDQLIVTFADILRELFDKPMEDIPVRFAKYFMTVASKVCGNKNVIQHVSEKCFYVFIEQILMKLLYDNLEHMGENNEGQYLVKALNLTILRILELYNPTKLFSIFIHLFMKYKDISSVNIKTAKLPSLVAKCILKLAKAMPTIIEHLSVPNVLLSLHEYLLLIPPSAIPKSANDDIGIRMAKTIIYELIKVRGESIWEDYKAVELHKKPDLHLQRWISHILGSFGSASFSPIKPCEESEEDSFDELQMICRGLNSQETFQKSIQRLSEYSRTHQNLNLAQYFSNYSKPFREFILSSLERYNSQCKGSVSPFEHRNVGNAPKTSNTSIAEYKNKLEFLKQKFDIKNKEDRGRKFLAAMNNMMS